MRVKLNAEKYIVGYGCFGNPDYPEYEWQDPPEKLKNKSGNLLYRWDGEKPIFSPQPYTPEQLEELRKDWCQAEIKKLYPADKESQILRKALAGDKTDYDEYHTTIENIIAESHKKDFQIEEKS